MRVFLILIAAFIVVFAAGCSRGSEEIERRKFEPRARKGRPKKYKGFVPLQDKSLGGKRPGKAPVKPAPAKRAPSKPDTPSEGSRPERGEELVQALEAVERYRAAAEGAVKERLRLEAIKLVEDALLVLDALGEEGDEVERGELLGLLKELKKKRKKPPRKEKKRPKRRKK